jgi:molybdopterin-guanine dinucleotide biosynthesis protein
MTPTKIAVSGFSSDAGKTSLVCELLRRFPGWEAIKITRGHYRSCGKDPHACCVSHLLSAEPVIRSGRAETYTPGKDTGRYWDAGASNVHWLIVTDAQVEEGIKRALGRVQAAGVFIEGTSFLKYLDVDYALMAARVDKHIKPSARRALEKTSAIYLFDSDEAAPLAHQRFALWRAASPDKERLGKLPVYTKADLPRLTASLQAVHAATSAEGLGCKSVGKEGLRLEDVRR